MKVLIPLIVFVVTIIMIPAFINYIISILILSLFQSIEVGSVIFGFNNETLISLLNNYSLPLVYIILIVSIILCIISIILLIKKSFLYSLPFFILVDRPDMTNKEIVEESARLMDGNKMRYFLLYLSFIGWAVLATLPLGIGFIWLIPYIMVASVVFYDNLVGRSSNIENATIEDVPSPATPNEGSIQIENEEPIQNNENENPIQNENDNPIQ